MYSILHETDDATSVNFCFWGKFLPYADLLVTAGAKTLRFFRLNNCGNSINSPQLECLLSFTMMAPIRGMAVIRLEGLDFLIFIKNKIKIFCPVKYFLLKTPC